MNDKDIKRIEYLLACAKTHQSNLSPHIRARASAIHLAGLILSVEELLHARHTEQLLELERTNLL